MNPKIFRAYDIRGKYPSEINEEVVTQIVQHLERYFVSKVKSQKSKVRVIIGHDARLSSPSLYRAVLNSLKAKNSKLKAISVGLATTPMFYFLVNHLKADAGIMITASHNPKEYNGLKVVGKNAAPISGKEIYNTIQKREINFWEVGLPPPRRGSPLLGSKYYRQCQEVRPPNIKNSYFRKYTNFLRKILKPQKPLKMVFDCSNGTTGLILKKILKAKNLKLKANLINEKPDGNFPAHGPDPLKKSAISNLQSAIYKYKADLGVIFDADGDRAFFVDNLGRPVDSDIIAYFLILKGGFKPPYLINVAEGKKPFYWFAPKFKADIIETRVGHYFIKKMMRKKDIEFAAEHSGHYYFALRGLGEGGLYMDSGIMAAIFIINAASKMPYSLADFVDLLPQHYQSKEIRIKYQSLSAEQKLLNRIEQKYKKQAVKISHIDGLSMDFGDWWFNLRHSNTESLLRLNIEAESKKVLQKEKKKLLTIIN